ncbi:MAG: DUF4097 family beta strand repeat-containing protein [Acidobacteriota bacterium]
MAQPCGNCGAELFAGQRFCRACGATIDGLSEEQTPTRMMSPPPADWGARSANTAPTPSHETSPVYAPAQYYQPSVPPLAHSMPPYQPPRSRSPLGWILALIGVGLFVALILAVVFVTRYANNRTPRFDRGSSRAEALSGETLLNETSAEQVTTAGNETTFIKTFELGEDATFGIKNINGSVTVETWDKPEVQVIVIKRGSESDRKAAQIYFKQEEDGLWLRTAYQRGSNNKSDVVYQIKLPRKMESVDLNTVNGGIKVSDISAEITAQTVNGLVDLSNVSGVKKAQSVNGNIKAVLKEAGSEPMEFKNVNGNIDLQIKGDLDAELEAASVRGIINIDEQFGVTVQKQVVGQKASGQIGAGGEPLKITTVNGSIKLSK